MVVRYPTRRLALAHTLARKHGSRLPATGLLRARWGTEGASTKDGVGRAHGHLLGSPAPSHGAEARGGRGIGARLARHAAVEPQHTHKTIPPSAGAQCGGMSSPGLPARTPAAAGPARSSPHERRRAPHARASAAGHAVRTQSPRNATRTRPRTGRAHDALQRLLRWRAPAPCFCAARGRPQLEP